MKTTLILIGRARAQCVSRMRNDCPACAVSRFTVLPIVVMASSAVRCAARWVTVTVSTNVRSCSTFASRPNGANRALAKFEGGLFWSACSRVGKGMEKAVTLTGLLGER